MEPKIRTSKGESFLSPVICEITGKQIAWMVCNIGFDPIFISFDVVDENGNIKQSTEYITTF
jgi:hypothetical protein